MKRYKVAITIAFILFLLPWMFYSEIPDIINPPTDSYNAAPEPVPTYDPIPLDAPIQVQYEGYPLARVLEWIHQLHPDSLVDMPMLKTIDTVCREKNVSLGLMLGIMNAEHSLLSASVLMAGGWQQYTEAPINPFSYGWTDENTVPMIGVEQSAMGAAGIVASAVKSWMQNGWGTSSFAEFISYLSQWYTLGPNAIQLSSPVNNWAKIASDTESMVSYYITDNYSAEWQQQIQTDLSTNTPIFGQKTIAPSLIPQLPSVISSSWHVIGKIMSGTYTAISSEGPSLAGAVGATGAAAAGINLLFTGIAALATAGEGVVAGAVAAAAAV